jgi:cellulose biosynthesis protein BcsQ
VDDLLFPAACLGANVFFLKGYPNQLTGEQVSLIPGLIEELKDTYIGDRIVDLVLVDTPGGQSIQANAQILSVVDAVFMPVSLSALDIVASQKTIGLISAVRERRGGKPEFLGFVPNELERGGAVERKIVTAGAGTFVHDLIERDLALPFIPHSRLVKDLFMRESSREGLTTVTGFGPHTSVGKRFDALWQALNTLPQHRQDPRAALYDFLNITADIAEEVHAPQPNI